MFKVPRPGADGAGGNSAPWRDDVFVKQWPSLAEWLSQQDDGQGHSRQTGTVLIFTEGGKVKCCLSDRESGFRAFLTADTLKELFAGADGGLREGTLDWRPNRESSRPRRG